MDIETRITHQSPTEWLDIGDHPSTESEPRGAQRPSEHLARGMAPHAEPAKERQAHEDGAARQHADEDYGKKNAMYQPEELCAVRVESAAEGAGRSESTAAATAAGAGGRPEEAVPVIV